MRLGTVAVLLALFALPLHAQAVTETLEVRLIEVDAVVTDRAGSPVAGLTAADFELFENGKPQAITNFSEYRSVIPSEVEGSGGVGGAPATQPDPSTPLGMTSPPRTIVLFIDAIPVRGDARTKLFDQLRSLVARTMREGDRAQLLAWDDRAGVKSASPLTSDRRVIEAAIGMAEVNANTGASGATVQEYLQFFNDMAAARQPGATDGANADATRRYAAEEELALMRRKTAAMQRIIASLAQPSGRSLFVYVTEVFPMVAGKRAILGRRATGDFDDPKFRAAYTTRGMLENVVAAANANGVSLYALRPVRPTSAAMGTIDDDRAVYATTGGGVEASADQLALQNEADALSFVAEQTGGALAIGPESIETFVERVVRDAGSYYTLAYRARSDGSDRERRVEVRATNPDHVVRTRRTVVEKSDRSRARDLAVARLFEQGPSGDLDFEVTTGEWVVDQKSKHVSIPVELSIPVEQLTFAPEGDELAAKFSVISVAGASLQAAGEITEDSRRVTTPPGTRPEGDIKFRFSVAHDRKPSRLSIAVFDEKSGLAGTRQIVLGGGKAEVVEALPDAAITQSLREARARAAAEKKPLLIYHKAKKKRCRGCPLFEAALKHPGIQRRLADVVLVSQPSVELNAIEFYDRAGTRRARWDALPVEPIALATLLDNVIAAAPSFERAVTMNEEQGPVEGEIEAAVGLRRLGFTAEARAAIESARAKGTQKTREFSVIATAMLDISEGKKDEALAALHALLAETKHPEVITHAWMGIALIHRGAGENEPAVRAYNTAAGIAGPDTEIHAAARKAIAAIEASSATDTAPLRLVLPDGNIVSGRHAVRTTVRSSEVARVVFTLDGGEARTVDKPPFSTTYDFGRVPQTRSIRAVAFDQKGRELGRDERIVNDAGETFWLRLTEPREGPATGKVRVTATMRTPAGRKVKRLAISWNDADRAVLTAAPWHAVVDVPNELGILRAVAELDDGRLSEDVVMLNATGYVDRADALLVELPIIVSDKNATPPAAKDLSVREGKKQRAIEAVMSGAEAPLTVGMLFDSSQSMHVHLPNVQDAAIRFVDTALDKSDRAFLITFDSAARLVQPPTDDHELLRTQIAGIRAAGSTALHDAMILGLLQFEGVKGRRALIVFSDGADIASRYQSTDVADLARRSNIPIYFIAVQPAPKLADLSGMAPLPPVRGSVQNAPPTPLGGGGLVSANILWAKTIGRIDGVVRSTGGRMHMLKKLEDLPAVYREIEADLRAQVVALIRTDRGKHENDWRAIDVEVAGRRGVRAPSGYYAPW